MIISRWASVVNFLLILLLLNILRKHPASLCPLHPLLVLSGPWFCRCRKFPLFFARICNLGLRVIIFKNYDKRKGLASSCAVRRLRDFASLQLKHPVFLKHFILQPACRGSVLHFEVLCATDILRCESRVIIFIELSFGIIFHFFCSRAGRRKRTI